MAPAADAATAAVPVEDRTRAQAKEKVSVRVEAAGETRAAASGPEDSVYAPRAVIRQLTHRARNVHR